MAWMLQPHNYAQVIKPNLYRVDYRRVGAYKGMGRGLGQVPLACDPTTDPTCSGALSCLDDCSPVGLQPGQFYCNTLSTTPNCSASPTSAPFYPTGGSSAASNINTWLPWIIGGGLVLLLLAGGRR